MNVIVLCGGVFGVTTAYYLLKDGHEVTQIERQPGVARECSHANGGLVAISQAATWSAGRAVQNLQDHRAARRADPDPPLPAAAHLALRPRLSGARPVDQATEATRIQRRDRNPHGALRRSSVRTMRAT
jgi:glycine/D-amino acid oxidase-like deaminating enzyme